jgi:tagaturonate reductase
MQLSKQNLKNISTQTDIVVPSEKLFSLPEKVLQFGTGVLLRGLPDYFIDKANRNGTFNGRVVVVKSTATGGTNEFRKQDNLYTLCVRGIENGEKIEEFILNSSISRVLSAKENWNDVLQCAHNPELKIIISNTTEVGITLTEDDIHLSPPQSFPGKLLSFLYARYKTFNGNKESGMVVIPTELITDNGGKLRAIVLELAEMNKLEEDFINWLGTANHFCNSLVDRIVPGKMQGNDKINTEKTLGYTDELMIMAEPFRLWAIESGNEQVKEILSFAKADDGVVIAPDIEKFRELKLRLLNGTHSFSCGLAFLAGFRTVKEAMNDPHMRSFIQILAVNEIVTAMSDKKILQEEACVFADSVMDRFRNPFIDHQWLSISVQYSSKMKMRNVPLLVKHYKKLGYVPERMSLGFAAYLLFMKCSDRNGNYTGFVNGSQYPVEDNRASFYAEKWNNNDVDEVVDTVLADKEFWETDLTLLKRFAEAVKMNLHSLIQNGVMTTIQNIASNKTVVRS